MSDLGTLRKEILVLSHVTKSGDWTAEGEQGTLDPTKMAKAIPPARWGEAFRVVQEIARAVPRLPIPIPGADPKGHVCLTWETVRERVAVDIVAGVIRWVARNAERELRGECRSLSELVRVLDETFPRLVVAA